ncbi:hypothetical protein EMGBS1_03170 [Chloroflexota bacterium]|nr:hypothetical protein EMGBS1_03170 [Chloroflexota bacterium]GBL36682.1 hypothetical protein EMGBD1_03690 [Anaerolineaceae bacterium]
MYAAKSGRIGDEIAPAGKCQCWGQSLEGFANLLGQMPNFKLISIAK